MINIEFRGPVALVILDGWGIAPFEKGNAIKLGKTPTMDSLEKKYPHCQITTFGKKVGLPEGQRGSSEAGHINLGAGRIVEQDVVIIDRAIKEGRFFKNPAFVTAINHVKKNKSKMHLIGLLSGTQSPHVNMEHLNVLLKLCKEKGVEDIFIHLFTDGRDAPQHAALKYLDRVNNNFLGKEKIATISGRFYGMDRNKQWDRTEKVYQMLTKGQGFKAETAKDAILQAYNKGETDEFIQPTIINGKGKPEGLVENNDSIIFFNLRSDRARQLSKAFVQQKFCDKNQGCFVRKNFLKNIKFVAMTDFGPDLDSILTAFPSKDYTDTLPMVLKDYKQLYISETEKYAHVTFFFNGGYDHAVAGEERILIPSPRVKSYADKPEMSLYKVTDELIKQIKNGREFITVNFCNADMIGHTGFLEAGIKAVEAIDVCVNKVVKEVLKKKGIVLITADHGNAEEMINLKTGEVDTEHSTFPVPFILVSEKHKKVKLRNGILGDVAPTILELLNVPKPKLMTGKSLIVK